MVDILPLAVAENNNSFTVNAGSLITIYSCTFINNNASLSGGAIYINTVADSNYDDSTTPVRRLVGISQNEDIHASNEFVPVLHSRFLLQSNDNGSNMSESEITIFIDSDFHSSDIEWSLVSTINSSDVYAQSNYTDSNVTVDDSCVTFIIEDSFGDGLNYGDGSWSVFWDDYEFVSPTNGDYGPYASFEICDPSLWPNTNIQMVLSLNDSNSSLLMLQAYEKILAFSIFNGRSLDEKLVFTGIKTNLSSAECVYGKKYCLPSAEGGQQTLKNILIVDCLWNNITDLSYNWEEFFVTGNTSHNETTILSILKRCEINSSYNTTIYIFLMCYI